MKTIFSTRFISERYFS